MPNWTYKELKMSGGLIELAGDSMKLRDVLAEFTSTAFSQSTNH
jgi:hypothetical protein